MMKILVHMFWACLFACLLLFLKQKGAQTTLKLLTFLNQPPRIEITLPYLANASFFKKKKVKKETTKNKAYNVWGEQEASVCESPSLQT